MSDPAHRTYQRIAPFYDLIDLPFEYLRYRPIRPVLFEGLSGRILDAGVGTGRNIAFYPAQSEVFGIDLSPAMLERAERRLAATQVTVHLLEMDLAALTFADDSFDAAVASFVFCTLPPQVRATALREIARVVRPGGPIRLLEYARPRSAFRRTVAKASQPWVQWAFGARLDQDIEPELAAAGLAVTRSSYVRSSIKLVEAVAAT